MEQRTKTRKDRHVDKIKVVEPAVARPGEMWALALGGILPSNIGSFVLLGLN
jgi:hypothetical protein